MTQIRHDTTTAPWKLKLITQAEKWEKEKICRSTISDPGTVKYRSTHLFIDAMLNGGNATGRDTVAEEGIV